MKLYGEEKNKDEIKTFVLNYTNRVKKNKRDRFHKIIELTGNGNNKKALDYGCGWGHYSVEMNRNGYNVDAIDYSKNEIDICKLVWNKESINFMSKQINELEDNTYDIVLSNQVIEHVHNTGNYLSEINRVMKTGGELIIALPNISNPRTIFSLLSKNLNTKLIKISKYINRTYNKAHDHINAWDPFHFVRLVSTVGFTLEEYTPMEGVPMPFKKLFSYIYPKNQRLKQLSYTMAFKFRKISNKTINNFE